MPKAIRMKEMGGPEILRWEHLDVGEPGGQARDTRAAVVTFLDL